MKFRSIFCAWHEPTKKQKEVDRVLPELLDLTEDQHVPGNVSGITITLMMFRGGEGTWQGSALQGPCLPCQSVCEVSQPCSPLPNLWLMVHMFSAVFFTQRDSSLHTVNSSSVHLQQSFLSNCFFALASSQVPKNASVSAGLLSGPGSK